MRPLDIPFLISPLPDDCEMEKLFAAAFSGTYYLRPRRNEDSRDIDGDFPITVCENDATPCASFSSPERALFFVAYYSNNLQRLH